MICWIYSTGTRTEVKKGVTTNGTGPSLRGCMKLTRAPFFFIGVWIADH